MENRVDRGVYISDNPTGGAIMETVKECPVCHKEYSSRDIIGTVPKGEKYVYMVECKECGRVFETKPDYKQFN